MTESQNFSSTGFEMIETQNLAQQLNQSQTVTQSVENIVSLDSSVDGNVDNNGLLTNVDGTENVIGINMDANLPTQECEDTEAVVTFNESIFEIKQFQHQMQLGGTIFPLYYFFY